MKNVAVLPQLPKASQSEAPTSRCSIRTFVIESFRQLIHDATNQLENWREQEHGDASEVLDELGTAIDGACGELEELSKGSAENWQVTLRHLKHVWRRLRLAIAGAKAEFKGRSSREGWDSSCRETENQPQAIK